MGMQAMIGAAHLSLCPEQARLFDIRSRAADAYVRAATRLAEYHRQIDTREDYKVRLAVVKHARAEMERAREACDTHRKDHGCG
jgi:hypothetical protein